MPLALTAGLVLTAANVVLLGGIVGRSLLHHLTAARSSAAVVLEPGAGASLGRPALHGSSADVDAVLRQEVRNKARLEKAIREQGRQPVLVPVRSEALVNRRHHHSATGVD